MANEGKLSTQFVEVFQDQPATGRLVSEWAEVFQDQPATGRLVSEWAEVFQDQPPTGRLTSQWAEVFSSFATTAVVPDITGTTLLTATFDSSASTGGDGTGTYLIARKWSWTSVPGGSALANITPTPMPDSGGSTFISMASNAVLYHCEGGTGTDSSGNGNTATLSNIISGGGKVGTDSWLYNTTTAKATLTSTVSLAGDWTLAFWFYNLGADGTSRSGACNAVQNEVPLRINTLNRLGVYFGGEQGSAFTMLAADYTGWHHIVAVGSGSTTTFYVDGVLAGTLPVKPNTSISCIGNIPINLTERFAERLDEVAIWVRALTADEVNTLYVNQAGNYAGTGTTFSFTPDVSGTYTVQFSTFSTLDSDSRRAPATTDSANAVIANASSESGIWPQERLLLHLGIQGQRLRRHRGQM